MVYKSNIYSYIEHISRLAKEIQADQITFVGMKLIGFNDAIIENLSFFNQEQKDYILSIAKDNGVEVTFRENKPLKRCYRPFDEIYILFDGSVTPCCNIVDDTFYSFGNLLKETKFNKVWNSPNARGFRKNLIEGRPYKLCSIICGLKSRKA